jgi:ABC-type multidrug transport system permease subunit
MTEQRSPLLELVKTRLREFYREPAIVFWVFGFPLLMAMGLGVAFRSKPPTIPKVGLVLVEAADSKHKNSQLSQALLASERIAVQQLTPELAADKLARSQLDLVLTLDGPGATYTFDPKRDASPQARLIVDHELQAAAGRTDPIATQDRAVTEAGSRYIDFLIPGLIGMNLMGSSMWGVGYNLVVARKRKLLRRYAVTPMRRSHFLLSYFLSRSLFLSLELALLVSFGVLVFGTVISGSVLAFIVAAVLGSAAFAGISLIIGGRLDNTETANGWMNFVQLPMYVLSGAFFPYQQFPDWMHPFIEALPLTALNNALRAVYNEGAGMVQIWPESLVLVAWGAAGFLIALRTFRWQ